MIFENEIIEAGYIQKTHGIKGEVDVIFDITNFDEEETNFLILNIDGIFVPFFVENYRFKNETSAIYTFLDITNEQQAKSLVGKTIFIHKQFLFHEESESNDLFQLIGFTAKETNNNIIGKIIEIENSTQNTLFIIQQDKNEIFIPATENFITQIDHSNQIIYLNLPEGLLNNALAISDND